MKKQASRYRNRYPVASLEASCDGLRDEDQARGTPILLFKRRPPIENSAQTTPSCVNGAEMVMGLTILYAAAASVLMANRNASQGG